MVSEKVIVRTVDCLLPIVHEFRDNGSERIEYYLLSQWADKGEQMGLSGNIDGFDLLLSFRSFDHIPG